MSHRNIGPHIADDVLEKYLMQRLGEEDATEVEQHLLVCPACQTQAQQTEEFILVTRAALRDTGRKPSARAALSRGAGAMHSWFTLTLFAAAVATLILVFALQPAPGARAAAVAEVRLYAMRGGDSALPQVRSGAKLAFDLEAEEILSGIDYAVRVVDSVGEEVWAGDAKKNGPVMRVALNRTLKPGRYWVRLYRSSDLVHEYGVQVQ